MKTDTFLIYVTIEIFEIFLAEKIIYKTQTVPNTYFHYKKYFFFFFQNSISISFLEMFRFSDESGVSPRILTLKNPNEKSKSGGFSCFSDKTIFFF